MTGTPRRIAATFMIALLLGTASCSWSQDEEDDPVFRPLIVVDSTVNSTQP